VLTHINQHLDGVVIVQKLKKSRKFLNINGRVEIPYHFSCLFKSILIMDKEIIMGCCEPVLGPIQNYYTKFVIDRKLEEITSAITSGCCITPEQVDEKIEDAIDEIQIPTNLSELTNDMGFISSDALSGYATTEYVDNQISSVTSVFITGEELSSYTYDKATIDSKIASGGTFDPTQYYNKTATEELLSEKLDASAYTPVDLSNYYNKSEVDGIVTSAITDVEAEIPTVPTNVSAFNNDAGYLTQHQSLSAYSTTQQMNTAISQATSGKVDTSAYTAYTASTQTAINNKADSSTLNNYMLKSQIWCGNYTEWGQISGSTDPNVIYLIHN
jgi:hypothetical protein